MDSDEVHAVFMQRHGGTVGGHSAVIIPANNNNAPNEKAAELLALRDLPGVPGMV